MLIYQIPEKLLKYDHLYLEPPRGPSLYSAVLNICATVYLVGLGTILMTLAALSLPCCSSRERDRNNFPFLECVGGWETTGGSTHSVTFGLILIRGGWVIIRVLLNIILCLRHIVLYVRFTVKELWQNLLDRKPLIRGNFQLRESIKREHTEHQDKWFRRVLCKLLYVCSSLTLCELSEVLAPLHVWLW